MPRKSPLNFETSLSDLEQLVDDLEQGDLPLEDALKHFEKGITLASSCQKSLQKAELKVQQLLEKNGELIEKPFDLDE